MNGLPLSLRRRRSRRTVRRAGLSPLPAFLLFLLAAGGLDAQEAVTAELRGRVLLGGVPVDTATVVLHQVGADAAGPVDSLRVETDGSFHFALPRLPGSGTGHEVYFASVRRHGILYFGSPISRVDQLDSVYTIQTYETRQAGEGGEELPVTIRNLFINRTEEGWRVTDLFEVRNESGWTWVSESDGPVWRYPLPRAATNFDLGQSDLPADAVAFRDGAMEVFAPIPPGERLYIITYDLEELTFDLPMPGRTEMLQLLISEPAPILDVQGLTQEPPVQMEEGVQFRRYAAEGVMNRTVRISEGLGTTGVPIRELAVLLALLLTGAAVWALMRRPDERPEAAPAGPKIKGRIETPESARDELLIEVARLDEEFGALDRPTEAARTRYREKREALIQRLRESE